MLKVVGFFFFVVVVVVVVVCLFFVVVVFLSIIKLPMLLIFIQLKWSCFYKEINL